MASRFYFLLSYVLPSFAYNMNYEAWLLNKKPPHFPLLFSLWMHKKDSPRILCHSSISKRSTRKWFNAPFFDTTPFFCCLHRKYLITLMHCFLLSSYSRPINSGMQWMHLVVLALLSTMCLLGHWAFVSSELFVRLLSLSPLLTLPPTHMGTVITRHTTWQWNPYP